MRKIIFVMLAAVMMAACSHKSGIEEIREASESQNEAYVETPFDYKEGFVEIDWTGLEYEYDEQSGELQFGKKVQFPKLTAGNSFVLPDDKYCTDQIRKVDQVELRKGVYHVYTSVGSLEDIFADLHIDNAQ